VNTFLRTLHRLEDASLSALLSALLLIAVAQILLRVFFNSGLQWAEPIGRAGVLWIALLGAVGAARERKHIAIDALTRMLPLQMRYAAWFLSQMAAAVVCAMLVRYGWAMVQLERETSAVFIAAIPSWWPMLAFPAGFALMGARFAIAAFVQPREVGT
jgi:C4-dicarboxylate transporter DctQ subunit